MAPVVARRHRRLTVPNRNLLCHLYMTPSSSLTITPFIQKDIDFFPRCTVKTGHAARTRSWGRFFVLFFPRKVIFRGTSKYISKCRSWGRFFVLFFPRKITHHGKFHGISRQTSLLGSIFSCDLFPRKVIFRGTSRQP
jgi:hypothetical protein